MTIRFANITLREDIIRRGSRAHTLRGVTALVDDEGRWEGVGGGPVARKSPWWRARFSRSSHLLTIHGPGFNWQIRFSDKAKPAAYRFAEDVNRAARRVTI